MRYWYLWRWVLGTAKKRGHTIRSAPEEMSWELVIEQDGKVIWYRLSANILKGDRAFAMEWKPKAKPKEIIQWLEGLKKDKTVAIDPGSWQNEEKEATTYFRLLRHGKGKILEDEYVRRYLLGKSRVILEPRRGVKGQWRAKVSANPASPRKKFSSNLPPALRLAFESDTKTTAQDIPNEAGPFQPWMRVEKAEDGSYNIYGMRIMAEGVWNGVPITKERMARIVQAFHMMKDTLRVPLKLEHSEEFASELNPALGWIKDLRMEDGFLVADLIKVPEEIVSLIEKGHYIHVSPEIAEYLSGFQDVLIGVALIGGNQPAILSLPSLIQLYSSQEQVSALKVPVPMSTLRRSEKEEDMANEKENTRETEHKVEEGKQETQLEALRKLEPVATALLFERKTATLKFERPKTDEAKAKMQEFVDILKLKGYPTVMAEEMLELMPEVTKEKVGLIPDYSKDLWSVRLDVLRERAQLPERCENLIKEIEEFLEMHKDELEEDELKAWQETLETAKKNKGSTTVEDAKKKEEEAKTPSEGEYPKYPKYPGYPAYKKPGEGEKYPEKEPSKEEEYPQQPPNVKIREMQLQLKQRATEAIVAKVDALKASGMDDLQAEKVKQLLFELDPHIKPNLDRNRVKGLVFELLALRTPSPRFSTLTMPQGSGIDREDLVKLLLRRKGERLD